MSIAIRAHFDGKVFVPDEPVDLPVGKVAEIRVESGDQPEGLPGISITDPPGGPATAQGLLLSGIIGLWADRDDIGDSTEFVRRLRRQAEQRTDMTPLHEHVAPRKRRKSGGSP
jgi:hypothetical protein